jgi:hypothetical protein
MTAFLQLDEERLVEQLVDFFERYDTEIKKAEPLFEIQGERLEVLARNLPYNQVHYDQLAQEAKQLVKWLENHMARIESRLTKNYLQGQRAYGQRETTTLIAGEKEMVEHKQLIIEASLYYQRLDSIVEGFRQMGWMLGNITKLRVASLQDAII